MSSPIYHAVPLSELRTGLADETYSPIRLAEDGFVHCSAGREVTLAVANDYFGGITEPLLLLEIAPDRLSHELRVEPPAPIAGGGDAHLAKATLFPHVYGPIDRAAIAGVGVFEMRANRYVWPTDFPQLGAILDRFSSRD